MKTIIILLNFLLISLIIYSFLNSRVVEYFINCPAGAKNAVTQQSSQLSRNQSQLNSLFAKYQQLKIKSNLQNNLIKANSQNSKNLSSDMMNEKDAKMKELDSLSKGFKGLGNVKGGSDSLNKLGKIMAKSPNSSV